MKSERVKMESGGKLGNDRKVKFVEPRKSVRWREKICGPRDIGKLPKKQNFIHFHFHSHFLGPTKQILSGETKNFLIRIIVH